jgi:DNA-binding MarR family transcriptional regulator
MHAWGSIKFNDGELIDQIHISGIISPSNLSIGVQIEGNRPTKLAIKRIKNDRENFLIILKKLVDFNYVIRKRYQIQASKWKSYVVAQILLGNEITHDDIEYIIKKMEQYNYVEIRTARIYDKHVVTKKGKKIIDECVDSIVLLKELIQFLR